MRKNVVSHWLAMLTLVAGGISLASTVYATDSSNTSSSVQQIEPSTTTSEPPSTTVSQTLSSQSTKVETSSLPTTSISPNTSSQESTTTLYQTTVTTPTTKSVTQTVPKDTFFLQQPSVPAMQADVIAGQDLRDTLAAHREGCVGMAANMIGVKKRIIIVNLGLLDLVMYNPILISKSSPYQIEEGCLSLTGARPTTRYQEITVRFFNDAWQEQTMTFKDFPAQIIQHELDHLEGIVI